LIKKRRRDVGNYTKFKSVTYNKLISLFYFLGGVSMKSFEEKLDQYAELVVKIGLNIQIGQRLLINSPIESADFTRRITKYAYEHGCSRVFVDWVDTDLNRIHYLNASDDVLKNFIQPWEIDKFNSLADQNDCMLYIAGTDPNA
jgi:aminopeptidase